MTPTTPPGTVPLMSDGHNLPIHPLDYADICSAFGCSHIGFRVVGEAVFNEWMTGLAKPNEAR